MHPTNNNNDGHGHIDILLPYDHFDIELLENVCIGLDKQLYKNFVLKILIDTVQKERATEILNAHPEIRYELFDFDIFDTVDLEYTAMFKTAKKYTNLKFNEDTLCYQQLTKNVTYGQLLQEIHKHSDAKYISVIDPYTELLSNHFLNLKDHLAQENLDLCGSNILVKGYFHYELQSASLELNPENINIFNTDNDPNNIITQGLEYYTRNQHNNISSFLFTKHFMDDFIEHEAIPMFSKFGIYWDVMIQANQVYFRHINQTSVCLNIDRYLDYYTHHVNGITPDQELTEVFEANHSFVQTLPRPVPKVTEEDFYENSYDVLTDFYYEQIPQINPVLDEKKYGNVLVTIGVGCYNEEKRLRVCLDRILNQTYKNLQIICVDDCSSDNTVGVLKEYAAKDSRIEIIEHEVNQGISAARNHMLDAARGEIIEFVDSDDLLRADTVEQYVKAFHKHPEIDFVQFKALVCLSSNTHKSLNAIYSEPSTAPKKPGVYTAYEQETVLIFGAVWINAFRLDFLNKHNLRFKVGTHKFEDALLMWRINSYNPKFYFLDESLYYYIMQPNSLVTSPFSKKDLTTLTLLDEYPDLYKDNYELGCMVNRLYIDSIWQVFINKLRYISDSKETPEDLAIQTELLTVTREKIIPRYHEYLKYFTEFWVNENSTDTRITIMLLLYCKSLPDADFQEFIKYIARHIHRAHSMDHFLLLLAPKRIYKSVPENDPTRKTVEHLYATLRNIEDNFHVHMEYREKVKRRLRNVGVRLKSYKDSRDDTIMDKLAFIKSCFAQELFFKKCLTNPRFITRLAKQLYYGHKHEGYVKDLKSDIQRAILAVK